MAIRESSRARAFATAMLTAALATFPAEALASAALWTSKCDTCHTTTPSGNQLNAGNSTRTVLSWVINNHPSMAGNATLNALTDAEETSIAQYINGVWPTTTASTAMNTPVSVNVSNNLNLSVVFTSVQANCLAATNGTLGTFGTDTIATFTPTTNFVGVAKFRYRGIGNATGDCREGSVNVGTVPEITDNFGDGTVGTAISYSIVATNNPSSYSRSGTLPPGVSFSAFTGAFSGTPTTVGSYPLTITANNYWGSDVETVTITIAKGSQSISFTQPTTPITYGTTGSFGLTASATSGLGITFSSQTSGVCSVLGSTVTVLSAGLCTIAANQSGNSNWFAATQVTRSVTINPANQTISVTEPATDTTVSYVHAGSTATTATATSGLTVTRTSASAGVCGISGTNVTHLSAGKCVVNFNQSGNSNYNAAPQVTRTITINVSTPAAPTIGMGSPGDTTAQISFTPSADNGGTPNKQYTATCIPPGPHLTRTGNAGASPITVTGMTNEVQYSCSVVANGGTGLTSPASGSVNVTPSPTPVAPAFTSANSTSFTVLSPGTFTLTASGIPAPTFSSVGNALPTGVSLNPVTGLLSGTPASGTSGVYNLTFRATNSAPGGTTDQAFTLTVDKISQSISFTDPADREFALATVPLSATATSGLTVDFATATPAVCSVTGTNATMLAVGACTISANQAGNTNFSAAPQVQQSFVISQGSQTISFAAQTTASRAYSNGGSFAISPTATASSNLTATYTSASAGVCSVSGQTVTMLSVGTCVIQAEQAGNANWNAATPVAQNVTLTQGTQTITFPVQAAQNYSPSGMFTITPPATSDSGLTISYSTTSSSVCSVSGNTVTIVAPGTCAVTASQAGNSNFAAATPVLRNITINATVPGAPAIGTATPTASGQLSVAFTAPANDGGSPITGYTSTCNPGGATGSGSASPLVVTGLSNGTPYTCSVTATNAVGTSVASATVNGTPSASGAATWDAVCSACHGSVPAGARFNAAGTTNTVLNHVIATQPDMAANSNVTSLTTAQRTDLVAHITSYLTPVQQTTAVDVPKTISVGSHLVLSGITFNQVELVSPPTSGTLGAFTGTNALFTPASGFSGIVTFQYRGRHSSTGITGDTHTATIVVDPTARVLTLNLAGGSDVGEVMVEDPGGTQFCGSNCVYVYADGSSVTLTATPMVGYVFTGWSGACSSTDDECTVSMTANRSVTATFALSGGTQHTLTVSRSGAGSGSVSSSPGGISCGSTCSAPFNENAVVTLTATATTGSVFSGWSGGGCSGTGACMLTMDAAKSVTATFTLSSYGMNVSKSGTGTGTVSSSPAGIDCGATCLANFDHGTGVSLTAAATGGSTFSGWSGSGCSGTGQCSVTMDGAKSVTATFTAPVVVTRTLSVAKAGTGSGSVTSSPTGIDCGATCSAPFADGATVTLFATPTGGSTFAGWSGDCIGNGDCTVTLSAARNVTATFNGVASSLSANASAIDFGGQSMGTTSPAINVTLTNNGAGPVTVSGISISNAEFSQTNDCTTVAAAASCTVAVRFSPAAAAGLLNATIPVGGTLNVAHNGFGSPVAVTVSGTAEKSLVTHYYYSILRRAPDPGGVPYWQGEAARVAGLGANVNETWFALAQAFYSSAEYLAFNRDPTGFVTDLYATFFNRAPDSGGLDYWVAQMNQGLPREVVLVSFMFSTEFNNFTQGIFGNTAARAEVDTVIDFYRGLLSRLPDSAGFNFWVSEFRQAQCQGAGAVFARVESISNAYVNSAEYAARGRTNAQFVGDMYNAFMRRGGDLAGVQFWIGQLDSGALTREKVRQAFISTPEFNARVQAVIAQGCMS